MIGFPNAKAHFFGNLFQKLCFENRANKTIRWFVFPMWRISVGTMQKLFIYENSG